MINFEQKKTDTDRQKVKRMIPWHVLRSVNIEGMFTLSKTRRLLSSLCHFDTMGSKVINASSFPPIDASWKSENKKFFSFVM